jgi:hypothetical protein
MPQSLSANLQPRSSYIIVDRRGQRYVGVFVRIVNVNGTPAAEFSNVFAAGGRRTVPMIQFFESQVTRVSFAPDNLF